MGGLTKQLFGGSSNKSSQNSESGNHAFGFLKDALGGAVGQAPNAMNSIGNLLGVNGGPAQSQGLQNYMDSGAFNSIINEGSKAITGNNASRGLLQSGATGKALTMFGQDKAQQKIDSYINNLSNLGQLGLGAAGIVGNAGSYATQQGKSSGSSSNGIVNSLFG